MGVEAQFPFRYVRTTIEYTTPDGKPYEPLDPEVHHRDESLLGIGDPWVLVRWSGDLGGTTISARVGASVPVGRTETNPFILGSQGKRHQHIQFGTGTVDPILALDLSKAFGRWLVSGYGQGQASLYENSHGYRSGLRISAGAQTGRKIWRSLTGSLGLEGLYEGPERWDGRIQQDGNLGRSEVLAALSLVHAFPKTTLGMSARVPIYRHIVAGDEPSGKFSSPLMLGIFAGRTFSILILYARSRPSPGQSREGKGLADAVRSEFQDAGDGTARPTRKRQLMPARGEGPVQQRGPRPPVRIDDPEGNPGDTGDLESEPAAGKGMQRIAAARHPADGDGRGRKIPHLHDRTGADGI
jgi:hypothetical protein